MTVGGLWKHSIVDIINACHMFVSDVFSSGFPAILLERVNEYTHTWRT
jgi:hypothetical protein